MLQHHPQMKTCGVRVVHIHVHGGGKKWGFYAWLPAKNWNLGITYEKNSSRGMKKSWEWATCFLRWTMKIGEFFQIWRNRIESRDPGYHFLPILANFIGRRSQNCTPALLTAWRLNRWKIPGFLLRHKNCLRILINYRRRSTRQPRRGSCVNPSSLLQTKWECSRRS